jgi:hypothetical protein
MPHPGVGAHEGRSVEWQRLRRSKAVRKTTPWPILRSPHQTDAERVAFHVATDSEQSIRRRDRLQIEALLVHRTDGELRTQPLKANGVGSCYPMNEA